LGSSAAAGNGWPVTPAFAWEERVTAEVLCPAHLRGTIDGRCPDCLAEAVEGEALIVAGVAAARAWAYRQREMNPQWPRLSTPSPQSTTRRGRRALVR
jgi:hypothetical protein